MLLEKTFHMSQPLAESKARLTSIQSYKRQFVMVTKATVTSSKTVEFSFRGPLRFEARTVFLAVDSDMDDQLAFESVGGNIDVLGLVDFTEIRPNCTEITLAIHYKITNRLFAWLDRHFGFVDTFVNAELRSIRAHFEGIATPYVERMPIMPMFETAAAALFFPRLHWKSTELRLRAFLFDSNGVGLVQTQDLSRFQRNFRFRIDNLLAVHLDAALFD